ncbi:234_t:CDS:2, partial [Cetraspora pellucida]
VLNDHPDAIINQDVQIILKSRGFFHDMEQIFKIFAPIRATILRLERANCTMTDCFIQLGMYTQITLYAAQLWQSMGYKDKLSAQTLIAQIIKFKEKEFLYNVGYDSQ